MSYLQLSNYGIFKYKMNEYLCLVIIIIVFAVIIRVLTDNEYIHIPLTRKFNIKTIFVCTTFDKYDYDFIMKWNNKLNFVVVYNGEITEYLKQLPQRIDIIKTENKGHDIGMWKYYITNNKRIIENLDAIILMNNSMLYNKINMNEVISLGMNYSMYSLYLTTQQNGVPPIMTSMFMMYNFDKLKVKDFIEYWDQLQINGRKEALEHESNQALYYYNLGYNKFGAYSSITLGPMEYDKLKTNTDITKYPLSIKKVCIIDEDVNKSDEKYKQWLKL